MARWLGLVWLSLQLSACGAARPSVIAAPTLSTRLDVKAEVAGQIKSPDAVIVQYSTPQGKVPNLDTLLSEHGIVPDGEAYAVVYALNPELASRAGDTPISPGETLSLPAVRTSEGELCGSRCSVKLTTNVSAKQELEKNVERANLAVEKLLQLPSEMLADTYRSQLTLVRTRFKSLVKVLGGRKHALGPLFIGGLLSESASYRDWAERALLDPKKLSDADLSELRELAVELEARASCCVEKMGSFPSSPKSSQARVRISLRMRELGAQPIPLRILAVAPRLKGKIPNQEFPGFAPAERLLDPGVYLIWGVDPDTREQKTDELRLPVVKGDQPVEGELLVRP